MKTSRESYDYLKSKVGDKLTDEEILAIIAEDPDVEWQRARIQVAWNEHTSIAVSAENPNVEGKCARIEITSDPTRFAYSANQEYFAETNMDGEPFGMEETTTTRVLEGDCVPGNIVRKELSQNASYGAHVYTVEERKELPDFSLHMRQALIGNFVREYSTLDTNETIMQIYIPTEEQATRPVKYSSVAQELEQNKLKTKIKEVVGEKLSDAEIEKIVNQVALEDLWRKEIDESCEGIALVVTQDPNVFAWNANETHGVETTRNYYMNYYDNAVQVVMGDCVPGKEIIYEYEPDLYEAEIDPNGQITDFSVNSIQAAIVRYNGSEEYYGNREEKNLRIAIYLPEEEKYGPETRYKDIINARENIEHTAEEIGEGIQKDLMPDDVKEFLVYTMSQRLRDNGKNADEKDSYTLE